MRRGLKNKIFILIMSLVLIISISGCNTIKSQEDNSTDEISEGDEDNKEIEVWSYFSVKERIDSFNKIYPDIKVKEKVIEFEDYVEEYLKALTSNQVPDVMIIDSTDFGNFNVIEGLEDLDDKRYNWSEYKKEFDKELIEVGKSLLDDTQIGIAYATAPYVTYYREDIMRENGFPSEPEELAKYIESEENYIKMAEELNKKGIFINQWPGDIIQIFYSSSPYFDKNFNYLRDTDEFEKAIQISNTMRSKNLFSFKSIWREEGLKNIKEGKQAMVFMGSWGVDEIESWVPEQAGKWRATRLPFNIYGWNNSTVLSIPQKSKSKDSAWKFIEFLSFKEGPEGWASSVPAYLPLRNNPITINEENLFLNNQKDKAFYEHIMGRTEEYQPTPLDKKAMDIWVDRLKQGYEEEDSAKVTRNKIRDEINIILQNKK